MIDVIHSRDRSIFQHMQIYKHHTPYQHQQQNSHDHINSFRKSFRENSMSLFDKSSEHKRN
jgi:hypothetical protein